MKKIVTAIGLLISVFSAAQPTSDYTRVAQGYDWLRGYFRNGLHSPARSGFPSSFSRTWPGSGEIMMDTLNHALYIRSGGSWRRLVDSAYVATSTSNIANVGTGYRLFSPQLSGFRSLFPSNTLLWDTTLSGMLRARLDLNYETLRKDTVEMFRFNAGATTTTNGWTAGATYSASTTETVVASGLQIVNSSTSTATVNSVRNHNWESCVNDGVALAEFQAVTWGATSPVFGLVLKGATNIFATSDVRAYVNATSGAVTIVTFTGVHAAGTLATSIAANDIIRISLRRAFDIHTVKITNLTKGTATETFTYDDNGGTGTSNLTNVYPGIIAVDGTYILRSFVYYAYNYNPDLMILGTSISNNQKQITDHDSTYTYRLNNYTAWRIECGAKSANSLEDMIEALPEIRKMKPRVVLIEGGYNNNQTSGQAPTTWGPVYQRLVDSLLANGIRVIVQRIIPANNTTPTTVNTWVDSTYSNHPKVQILNLFNTTLLYKGDTTNFYNNRYYSDGVHPNEDGGEQMFWYVKTQLERMLRPQMAGVTDAATLLRRDKVIYVYDSAGVNQGTWNPYRMVGFTFDSGAQTVTASGGGGTITGPGSSTDNAVVRWDGTGGTTIQNSTVIISDAGAITGIASMATANVTIAPYNSGATNDALKISNSNVGATLGIQNNNGGGFSGIEYYNNSGTLAVFTGFANGVAGQFRFNNVATSGNFVWMIAGTPALTINNAGEILANNVSDQGSFGLQTTSLIATGAARFNSAINLNGSNGTSGQFLISGGSGAASWTTLPTLASGTYLPTGTAVTSITSVTPNSNTTYTRVGDIVTVSGTVLVNPAAEFVNSEFGLSLPIPSDFSASTEGGGSGAIESGTINNSAVVINMDATNDRASFRFHAPLDGVSVILSFTFSYRITPP